MSKSLVPQAFLDVPRCLGCGGLTARRAGQQAGAPRGVLQGARVRTVRGRCRALQARGTRCDACATGMPLLEALCLEISCTVMPAAYYERYVTKCAHGSCCVIGW